MHRTLTAIVAALLLTAPAGAGVLRRGDGAGQPVPVSSERPAGRASPVPGPGASAGSTTASPHREAARARYGWPLRPVPRVAARFQEPADRYAPGHRGADLVGAPGQGVLAARSGVVVFAGPLAGRGVVSVRHPDGLRTTYEPVTATVAAGAVVERGGVIGALEPGHAGCPAAACLHWGVRRGEADYLDPLVLVGPGRVRLLPVRPWPR